jgi:hypothetical protein
LARASSRNSSAATANPSCSECQVDFIDDGPGKPVGINQEIGRRPIAAFGNSDGDLEMLQWTTEAGKRRLGLVVHHTNAEREYAYDRQSHVGKLDKALDARALPGYRCRCPPRKPCSLPAGGDPNGRGSGIRMCIHPDDPPRPLMGLPRIVSNAENIAFILEAVNAPANGLTLCSGSLGANLANNVPAIAQRFASRIWFAHLRNVSKEPSSSFMEADHLGGDTDMVALVTVLLEEQKRRKDANEPDWRILMRPDHSHELLDDVGRHTHPGYPMVGRMRGLAELRGVMTAVSALRNLPL